MIDVSKDIVKTLKNILPTYHELKLSSGTNTPCISYQERNNAAQETGETLGYSRITYTIKVWGYNLEELNEYAALIDNALRPIGWKRTSAQELYSIQSGLIQKIMTFEANAKEAF